jgi:CAAX prenyl protease-like protein
MTPATYWKDSQAPRYSLLFALPLIVLYEALAIALAEPGGGVRNAADVILRQLFTAVAGAYGHVAFWLCLIGAGLWLVVRDLRRNSETLRPVVFGTMLAESAGLALVVGVVVGTLTATILRPLTLSAGVQPSGLDLPNRLMVSLGAGLYEELLFRVLLVSLLAYAGMHLLGWRAATAGALAVIGAALVFSAFHYVGPYGDRPEIYSFTFRFVAGLFFSTLYLLRGFGITAWTHALYDVFLLVI